MRAPKLVAFLLLGIMAASTPLHSNAQSLPDMWVTVGTTTLDNVTNPDGTNTNRVVLAPAGQTVNYGNIAITNIQAGQPAMVERVADDTMDYLALHNVKITRTTGPVANFPITFGAKHLQPPLSPPNYYYNLEVHGKWSRPPVNTTNSLTVNAKIQLPPLANPIDSGTWQQYQTWSRTINCPAQPMPCTLTFDSPSLQSSNPITVSDDRALKGELTFTLSTNNDALSFSYQSGIFLKSGAQQDCPPPKSPKCKKVPGCPCKTNKTKE